MKNKYVYKQHDLMDCGVCCLASIIKYYGGSVPIETIRLDSRCDFNGTNALNMINAANKYGLYGYGEKVFVFSKHLKLPAIAHVCLENGLLHFVVIYEYLEKKDLLIVMDPARGMIKYNKNEFKKIWTGVLIHFKPYKKVLIIEDNNTILKIIKDYFKNHIFLLIFLFFLLFVITICSIIIGFEFQIIYSNMNYNFLKNLIFFAIIIFFKHLINYIKNNLIIKLNYSLDKDIFLRFIKHIFYLPLNVIKNRKNGEIMTRVFELNNIKLLISELMINLCFNFVASIFTIVVLFIINRSLFFILCISLIIYFLLYLKTNKRDFIKINNNIELESNFNSTLLEKIDSLESIKNLNVIDNALLDINHTFCDYLDDGLNYQHFKFNNEFIKNVLIDFIYLFIILGGFVLVKDDKISIMMLITFYSLSMYCFSYVKQIVDTISYFNQIKLSIHKTNDFLNTKVEDSSGLLAFKNGSIVFENVSYSYDGYNYIIRNKNFEIKERDRVIIKGSSGIGKSTLFKMINRTIDDYEGKIFISGINIKQFNLVVLRKNICYVSQNEKLFSGTIRSNLLLGEQKYENDLDEVLDITCCREIINKKNLSLDSYLMVNGFNLSGGENQRLILARAVLRKPKILILDESLSEIDNDCEEIILRNISDYLKESTIIYISHSVLNFYHKVINI